MSAKRGSLSKRRNKRRQQPAPYVRTKKKSRPIGKAVRRRTAAGAKSRPARRRATPRTDRHLDFIDAAARVLDLAIEPSWKPAIEANLEATLQLAASFMEFPLPDEAEPAPIFTA